MTEKLECLECGTLMPLDNNFCPICHDWTEYDIVLIEEPRENTDTDAP